MLSFNLWDQVPQLNTKIDFTRLPVALDDREILVLSRINGLISLGELASAYRMELLEMERIIAKLVKADLILFPDPRVRQELVEEIDEARSVDDHTTLVDEVTDTRSEVIDRQFEAPSMHKESGEWNLTTLFPLLNDIHIGLRTGVLRIFFQPNMYKALFFEEGELVNISSVPFNPGECLGRLLQRAGRLTQDRVVKSLERVRSTGRLQGEELISMGMLREDLLPEMLRVQMEVKLTDVLAWEEGKWEFQPLPVLPPRIARVPIDLPRLVFALIWKRYPFELIREELDRREEMYVGHVDKPPYLVDDFYFGQNFEKFYKQILEKDNLLKRILIVSHLKPEQTYRILWALYLTGMIDFFEDTREDKAIIRIAELQDRLKAIERESLFDVLGIHWTSNDAKVMEAYKRRMAEQKAMVEKTEGLERHLNEKLIEHIEIAYDRLRDASSRNSYRHEIFDEDFIIFGSDILRQKGESYLFTKEEVDSAINELTTAVEVYDKDGEYWAALGLSRFYKYYPRDVREYEEARRLIRRGYSMNNKSEVTNLCMGLMYKREKRNKQAMEWLGKVKQINPKNRFAYFEMEEIKTGRKHEDRDKAIREFLDRRAAADEDFERRMEEKRIAKEEAKKKKPKAETPQ